MPSPHQPLETYLRDLRDGRAIGVAEASFYPYLSTLLNAAGAGLKPKVRCILHPKSVGAGLPDGGLYTSDQLPKDADAASIAAQLPARGVLEVKGTAADVDKLAGAEQVRKYLARYSQVLVTNYRDFLLVGKTGVDTPVKLERYSLAPNEAAFWQAAASPEKLAAEHGDGLMGYLQRVMLSNAPLADPKDVAWFLASYARDARARVERAGSLPALAALRTGEPETKLIDEKRSEYWPQVFEGNLWLGAAQKHRRDFDPPLVTGRHASLHVIERGANMFPLYLQPDQMRLALFADQDQGQEQGGRRVNLTEQALAYLKVLGSTTAARLLFQHTVAVLHAPVYGSENAGALRQDWPRVPLPRTQALLEASAALGHEVSLLLDPERSVAGVNSGATRLELQKLGGFTRLSSGGTQPGDLELTAGWGYVMREGIIASGRGDLRLRDYTPDERAAIAQGAVALGLDEAAALAILGEQTCDVYLNELAYWRNVPVNVWEYTIGGYQVLKKWLSYRERDLLGRALKVEEAREVTAIVRRIAALLLMGPQLDANYRAVAADIYEWKQ